MDKKIPRRFSNRQMDGSLLDFLMTSREIIEIDLIECTRILQQTGGRRQNRSIIADNYARSELVLRVVLKYACVRSFRIVGLVKLVQYTWLNTQRKIPHIL